MIGSLLRGSGALVMVIVLVVVLAAQDLPWKIKDEFGNRNFEELQTRRWHGMSMIEYGHVTLTAGSAFVELNYDYLSVDYYSVYLAPRFVSAFDSNVAYNRYAAAKITGDSIEIVALDADHKHDYSDTLTVEFLVFLKDR